MKGYLKEIVTLLGKDKKRLPGMILLFLLLSVLDLAGIAMIGPYIGMLSDEAFAIGAIEKVNSLVPSLVDRGNILIFVGFMIVLVFLFKTVIATIVNYVITQFSVDQQTRLRAELMQKYQSLPYEKYLNRNTSDYINNIQILVNHYSKGVIANALKMASDGIVALVIITFLLISNAKSMLLLAVVIVPVLYVYDRSFKTLVQKYGKKSNIAISDIIKGIHEGMGGFKELRVLGLESFFHDKVKNNSIAYGNYHVRSTIIGTVPRYLIELLVVTAVVLIVSLIFSNNDDVRSAVPVLAVFGLAAMRLVPTVSVFSQGLVTLRRHRDSVNRLYLDISSIDEMLPDHKQTRNTNNFQSLSIKNASFSYPGSRKQKALTEIDLDLLAGQSIGLIGESGSGKTTLVDMILGLLKPQSGDIFYNREPLEESLSIWRSHVAYIPQDPFLIDDTLRRNIALGVIDEDIDDEKVTDSLNAARLSDLVETMSEGIDTIVGERGMRLSGGQKQRVSLARAFYHDRDVLILDEATSALDDATEREIVAEILQLKGKKTMIVIAHRLSTVAHCDWIYRLGSGEVLESGTPKDVI